MAYGLFLCVAGGIGWLLVDRTSISALVNGGILGVAMVALGFQMRLGRAWTVPASLMATAVFTATFVWRSVHHFIEAGPSSSYHWSVAALMVVLTLVSLLLCLRLIRLLRYHLRRH